MKKVNYPLVAAAAVWLLAACAGEPAREPQTMEFTSPAGEPASVVMQLPVTTASDEAREHFLRGLQAMDRGRVVEAHSHFEQALEADSSFAQAYLNAAATAPSLDEFTANLDQAAQHAEAATETEQLLIEMSRKGFQNDVESQFQLASQLVEMHPTSARARLSLAGIQTTMGKYDEARSTMMEAAELAPEFAPAYIQLGNSNLFNRPKDLAKAEEYFQRAVDLEPNEPVTHDVLGDVRRAQGDLEKAREAYTRAAELDPTNGLPLQQRGHVNSFLGNYEEARADYDSAIALGRANQGANYAVYRAYVHVYEGDPVAAIDELNGLVNSIDDMGIPNPIGAKTFALTSVAIIAMHHGRYMAAEQALAQRTQLMMTQVEEVRTDEFRRGQEANIAYFDGLLAARKGEYAAARTKAEEFATLVEPNTNPRKMEPMHEMLGLTSLLEGNYDEAITQYEQGNPNNIYTTYHLALAHEGAGNTEEANRLFAEVANFNFNNVGFALARAEAMRKAQ